MLKQYHQVESVYFLSKKENILLWNEGPKKLEIIEVTFQIRKLMKTVKLYE